MKTVYEAANAVEAHMLQDLLRSAHIHARVDGAYLQGAMGELPAAGLVRLVVEDEDWLRARAELERWEAEQPRESTAAPTPARVHWGLTLLAFSLGVLAGWLLAVTAARAADAPRVMELDTPGYTVRLEIRCDEGEVSCDRVTYTGTSRRSGAAITLPGATWHTPCADGVTPCRFQGWQFRHGATVYRVTEGGRLIVTQGTKALVEEQGTWR